MTLTHLFSALALTGACLMPMQASAAMTASADLASAAIPSAENRGSFVAGKGQFLLNGKPFVVKAAELHYPRIPRP